MESNFLLPVHQVGVADPLDLYYLYRRCFILLSVIQHHHRFIATMYVIFRFRIMLRLLIFADASIATLLHHNYQ